MTTPTSFDLIIIGAGPGGYVAAIRAAQLGLKTAVIEREHLGGVCLNWGCIPTKALLRSAEVYRNMTHAEQYGLTADKIGFDLEAVVKRSRQVSAQLSKGVAGLLKKNKVTVIDGEARLDGSPGKLSAIMVKDKAGKETRYTAKNTILATGARARVLPGAGLEPDGKFIWTAREAMVPDTMPKKLLVIGSGAIGIEFASFYNALGADVTVVEMMDRVLPVEDEDISAFAAKSFKKQGMSIKTSATVEKVEKGKTDVTAHIKDKAGKVSTEKFDRVILAIGIVPNTDNIGLEKLGIKTDRGHVVVNEWLATSVPGVFAIGDIVGPPWLAHKAEHEGVICVEKIAGQAGVHPLDAGKIPGCTYCHPQVASIGMTESAAKAAGKKIKVGKFPFIGNGKAIALGEAEGLVKTLFDATTGELLGAHMVGAEVTELIQGFSIGMTLEGTEEDFFHTVFPHPTLSEMMHESSLDAFGRVIHM
ncbi:MAG: dihydrolipoyl dehydrogenase [Parvularcula sp.]